MRAAILFGLALIAMELDTDHNTPWLAIMVIIILFLIWDGVESIHKLNK